MAAITRYPFVSRLRADTTMYVQHLVQGKARHRGRAASFWFRPAVAAIAEVPLDDQEQTLLVTSRTADFQVVRTACTVTFRIVDPELCLYRINFGIDPSTGLWAEAPLEVVGGLLVQVTTQPVVATMATLDLRSALRHDIAGLRDMVLAALRSDPRLAERGLEVVDVSISSIRTDSELERALQTEVREQVQQESDKATFERRALAVERERAIAENELQNRIALATREHELVTREGRNGQERATAEAVAARITAEAEADRGLLRARAAAEEITVVGTAKAQAEREHAAAYEGLSREVLLAVTAQRFSGKLPKVDSLTITPDLLTGALQRFVRSEP